MGTTEWIGIGVVVVIIVIALVALATSRRRSRARLRDRFGPEYDRTVESAGSRTKAEHELQQRQDRHDALDIHPLEPRSRSMYRADWEQVQSRFVDDPRGALASADTLVSKVMAGRGYPVGSFEQRTADLSVDHGHVLDHYRAAHAIDKGDDAASTEQLREAMVHYRAMFAELLDDSAAGHANDSSREAS